MLSDEEKTALELIKINNKHKYCDKDDVDFLLNLIEKQSKEIEELKNTETYKIAIIDKYKYISKDKIKAKIEIRKEEKENCKDSIEEKYLLREIYVLQSLLEKEDYPMKEKTANIDILEEKIKIIESLCTDDCINKETVIKPFKYAISNLIAENKELKEENEGLKTKLDTLIEKYKELKEELDSVKQIYYTQREIEENYIPKSKLKAKIEEVEQWGLYNMKIPKLSTLDERLGAKIGIKYVLQFLLGKE